MSPGLSPPYPLVLWRGGEINTLVSFAPPYTEVCPPKAYMFYARYRAYSFARDIYINTHPCYPHWDWHILVHQRYTHTL